MYEQNLLSNMQILLSLIDYFRPEGKLIPLLPKILTVSVVEIHMKNGRIESTIKPLTIFKYVCNQKCVAVLTYFFEK